ncbi:MAG: NYN domain-containing protein [Anaerolineaceae bacterium]|nr:NYN domain-containing protein [Anaerolineaceae bacterium]
MPYLIDGHNLIPWVRGLSLADVDDELQLVERLQNFCRIRRTRVEVYFDRAAPGRSGTRTFGSVLAYFVDPSQSADWAITNRLRKLRGGARNWTVVSSDQEVKAAAGAAGARVVESSLFGRQMDQTYFEEQNGAPEDEKRVDVGENEDWLRLFGADDKTDK